MYLLKIDRNALKVKSVITDHLDEEYEIANFIPWDYSKFVFVLMQRDNNSTGDSWIITKTRWKKVTKNLYAVLFTCLAVLVYSYTFAFVF